MAFADALKKADIKCRWHDLRYSSVARTGEGGASEQTLLALSGWISHKMPETYPHTRIEAKRQATKF